MIGWAGLAGYIAAYDAWALLTGRSTLSARFARAPKAVTIPVTAYVCAHLYGRIPQRVDPLIRLAALLTPRGSL